MKRIVQMLEARLKELGKQEKAFQQEFYKERRVEFEKFERVFEQCISRCGCGANVGAVTD